MEKKSLLRLLNKEFRISEISDVSLNGLQVDNSRSEVKKIIFATDVSLESICKAREMSADMLLVHHGFFWGKPLAVTGEHYNRLRALIDADMALYAIHLPLDMHPRFGNNAQMAIALGLVNVEPFGEYHGNKIGFKGVLEKELTSKECADILGFNTNEDLKILEFGKKRNKTVGIISGGAACDVNQAIEEKLDLYISGEHEHIMYHTARENSINVILGGHYRSEVFGVKAVCEYVKTLGIAGEFVDCPTGM